MEVAFVAYKNDTWVDHVSILIEERKEGRGKRKNGRWKREEGRGERGEGRGDR